MQKRISACSSEVQDRLENVGRYSITLRGFQYLQAQQALRRCGGSYDRAARVLSVTRETLYRRLDRPDLLYRSS